MSALEDRLNRNLARLATKLSILARDTKRFDLAAWITFFTFDVLGEVAFSTNYNFLATGRDHNNLIHAVQETTPLLISFSHVPWLVKLVQSAPSRRLFGRPRGIAFLDRVSGITATLLASSTDSCPPSSCERC